MPNRKRIRLGSNKVKDLHPRSRKVVHVARQVAHDQRVKKQKDKQKVKAQRLEATISWFRDRLLRTDDENGDDSGKKRSISMAELRQLAVEYVSRTESQSDDLPESKQHDSAKKQRTTLRAEFQKELVNLERNELKTNGLSVPDLTRNDTYSLVRSWSGDTNAVQSIAFTRIIVDESAFGSGTNQKTNTSKTLDNSRSTAQILASTSRKRTRDDQQSPSKIDVDVSDGDESSDSDSEIEICIKRSRPSL